MRRRAGSVLSRVILAPLFLLLVQGPGGSECAAQFVRDSIPGTLVTWELVQVPNGTVTLDGRTVNVAPFLIGRTEVTWDMYDVYMHRLDEGRGNASADAIARPSQPYAVPDYEWGHAGYAAISIALGGAKKFCEWLSAKTGHRYRLATEAEWLHAARLAVGQEPLTPARIDDIAWHRGNANRRTHPSAARQPDALGLYDLFGNVAEWVIAEGQQRVTRGGSFRDDAAQLGPAARAVQDATWTERDPQLPASVWWLSDGPFVGFRLVRDP
jgi:formylglycine-generating enzyme required for sulfatase activity